MERELVCELQYCAQERLLTHPNLRRDEGENNTGRRQWCPFTAHSGNCVWQWSHIGYAEWIMRESTAKLDNGPGRKQKVVIQRFWWSLASPRAVHSQWAAQLRALLELRPQYKRWPTIRMSNSVHTENCAQVSDTAMNKWADSGFSNPDGRWGKKWCGQGSW